MEWITYKLKKTNEPLAIFKREMGLLLCVKSYSDHWTENDVFTEYKTKTFISENPAIKNGDIECIKTQSSEEEIDIGIRQLVIKEL